MSIVLKSQFLSRYCSILKQYIGACYCTKAVDLKTVIIEAREDDERTPEEIAIEGMRNKSGLKVRDYKVLHGIMTNEDYHPKDFWLSYNRSLYGRFGEKSKVDPSICFPTKRQLYQMKDFESVAYPFTIPEMIQQIKEKREQVLLTRRTRQQTMVKQISMLKVWRKQLDVKVAKKEAEALEIKKRKDRVVEEIRAHFGYAVDAKDQKFRQMLEQKEKEEQKALKLEMRQKRRELKMQEMIGRKDTTLLPSTSDGTSTQ